MKTIEQKRTTIENVVKVAGVGLTGFMIAPFVFIAIKGMIGLIIAAVVSLVAINLTPWFAAKVANWKLKALKHEASKNPIETLENQYKEREEALVSFRQNILAFHAEVNNFYGELDGFRKKSPARVHVFEAQYANMKALLASRGVKYKQAQKNLEAFAEVIDQKRSEWNIAEAAAKMSKAAGVGEDFMSKLMADTALDSVQNSLNLAFAELDVAMLDEAVTSAPNTPAAIAENSGPPALDLDFVSEPEPVTVTVNRSRK